MNRLIRFLVAGIIFSIIFAVALYCAWNLIHDPIVKLAHPSEEVKKLIIFTGALGFLISVPVFVVVALVVALALGASFTVAFLPAALAWRLLRELDRSRSAIKSYDSSKWKPDR